MSGRKINDFSGLPHTSDMAMKSKNDLKHYSSAEGSGHVGNMYSDTTEMVKRDQDKGNSQVGKHPIRPGYRY